MPLQKPHSRNSEVTSAKVTKRFLPSAVRNNPPPVAPDELEVWTGVIMFWKCSVPQESLEMSAQVKFQL